MKQQSLSDIEYSNRKKKTKREEFLDSMDQIIPWEHWIDLIKVHYPSGKRGRPTRGIETMLRMYLMQNWFNLSDAAIENRKSSTRCKVEHPFLIVKRQFGYCKTAYKGLAKNMNRSNVLLASANLVMCIRAGRTETFCMG